ncbi:MAG: VOC family protein [Nitrososphaerota archaeon]|nr:VOC family protein [Nitrososphaerota archaeon]
MTDHFNSCAIPVRDLAKCVSFYQDKVGLKLQHKRRGHRILRFPQTG